MTIGPSNEIRERLEALLGHRPTAFHTVEGGYTPAQRWCVDFTDRGRVFAKIGTTDQSSSALRKEYAAYSNFEGKFMPELRAFDDHPDSPILLIEDLRDAQWPPPWTDSRVADVLSTLNDVHSLGPPIEPFSSVHSRIKNGWREVEANPDAFDHLALVSREWRQKAISSLVEAADRVNTDAPTLIHFDVRSDNLCIADRGAVLIDWNVACLGNPDLDTGFWLPSLHSEGGPPPESILADSPEIAAWVSGFFAARAGLPIIPYAPRVRTVQLSQLRMALPWAMRALKLPEID